MKTNQELIKELRVLTQAGMSDCKKALEENEWDLQKATDAVKIKGLQNTSRNAGKLASEGAISIVEDFGTRSATLIEVNCQTDFVANSPEFKKFVYDAGIVFSDTDLSSYNGDLETIGLEQSRKELMALTKENIVVRRWNRLTAPTNGIVSVYLHSNSKIGVMLSLEVSSQEVLNNKQLYQFGEDLAMQIAAMNPLSVSRSHVSQADVDRQKAIFETQLTEANKPQAAWSKILDGKFNKWFSEVCLLDQESVIVPKKTIKQLADELSKTLSGEVGNIKILNFVRFEVGEGLDKKEENFASEVAKLSGE